MNLLQACSLANCAGAGCVAAGAADCAKLARLHKSQGSRLATTMMPRALVIDLCAELEDFKGSPQRMALCGATHPWITK